MKFNLLLTVGEIWAKAWPILLAVMFFGLIIFIHEFGHFIFAKLFGVKVNEFAMGMGPIIFKKQGKETKYALRLFPIGGFCAMEGESEESDDERAFCNKKLWQRMIIIVAGATFNIILGLILCVTLVGMDDYVGTSTVLQFYDGAVSSQSGLCENDKILEIDGKAVFSDYDLSFLMQRNESGTYHFVVERDGKKVDLPNVNFARRTSGNFSYDENCVISNLGSKVKKAGLEENDKIIAVNGKKVKTQENLIAEISADDDFTIDFTVERNKGNVDVNGVKMNVATVFDFVVLGKDKSFGTVVSGGFRYALSMSRMVYLCLFDLLRGHYGLSDMAGPIGTISVISDVATTSASSMDWSSVIMMMALITINIGLFNLLPVPALDGGHFFFMLVELLFRKPVPAKYENWIHVAGMVLLILFMIIISASDIWKLISGTGFY